MLCLTSTFDFKVTLAGAGLGVRGVWGSLYSLKNSEKGSLFYRDPFPNDI